MLALACLVGHVRTSMTYQLKKSVHVGLQMDAWSSAGHHLAALCASVPGVQFFANAYENCREGKAA
jgi:hypothetical protein